MCIYIYIFIYMCLPRQFPMAKLDHWVPWVPLWQRSVARKRTTWSRKPWSWPTDQHIQYTGKDNEHLQLEALLYDHNIHTYIYMHIFFIVLYCFVLSVHNYIKLYIYIVLLVFGFKRFQKYMSLHNQIS
jgi:hypothetical protein